MRRMAGTKLLVESLMAAKPDGNANTPDTAIALIRLNVTGPTLLFEFVVVVVVDFDDSLHILVTDSVVVVNKVNDWHGRLLVPACLRFTASLLSPTTLSILLSQRDDVGILVVGSAIVLLG